MAFYYSNVHPNNKIVYTISDDGQTLFAGDGITFKAKDDGYKTWHDSKALTGPFKSRAAVFKTVAKATGKPIKSYPCKVTL
tara:strand:+ start:218 stop:460 length:243 start_codon:yes stop_codon:yes gene_type:complete